MEINFKYLEKNGHLKQEDYKKLTTEWLALLNPVRVSSIRKYLKFSNLKYEVYQEEIQKSKHVIKDVEEEIDLLAIPLIFVTTFSSTLFPEFQDEYFAPLSFLTSKHAISLKGLKIIESCMYHSLTKAQYDLDVVVKDRFSKSKKFKDIAEDVATGFQFLLPFDIDSEFPMTIIMSVNMIAK